MYQARPDWQLQKSFAQRYSRAARHSRTSSGRRASSPSSTQEGPQRGPETSAMSCPRPYFPRIHPLHLYFYTYINTHIHTYSYVYMGMCLSVYLHMCTCMYMQVHTYEQTRVCRVFPTSGYISYCQHSLYTPRAWFLNEGFSQDHTKITIRNPMHILSIALLS